MNVISKVELIAIATTHPNMAARRSACYALHSFGMLAGNLDMARADAKLAAAVNAAQSVAAEAINKAGKVPAWSSWEISPAALPSGDAGFKITRISLMGDCETYQEVFATYAAAEAHRDALNGVKL